MLGNHLIAAWSRAQPRIALSSGEAELYAAFLGIFEALGFVHMMRGFQTQDWGRIIDRVDAGACRTITLRRGCGGLKVQEAVREYLISIERVPRDAVHTHILASPSSPDKLKKYLQELNGFRNLELVEGGDRGIEEEFCAEMPRESQR